ncbi:hypothetical protein J4573_19995 [Actinomadura barringtoniae]|uniref:Thioesterase family protein n=1 Tax=Actinomadura barringtoniae TaxID=1427535 RepID=A0A939T5D8_9ACTN|nr:hypothetical protein [Actinomadura barringtoniae]MBO2449394.1 hypothetical protein [Actinomadura barringtoniae]
MIIDARYCGPDGSGNGGYVAGLLSKELTAHTVTVTLRQPPPLAHELRLDRDESGNGVRLFDGERLIAEAFTGAIVVPQVPAVPYEVALEGAEKYRAAESHPFPRCFVCGPEREDGMGGMGLEPGPVGEGLVASPWTAESPSHELLWAALDCPGGWSCFQPERPALLGTMTAQVVELPRDGERCVVMGLARSREGRKLHAATAAYGADGRLLGRAEQIWIQSR